MDERFGRPDGDDGDTPLTLRYLVEGPSVATTDIVTNQLCEQFRATLSTAPVISDRLALDWFESTAGSFEGKPIRFEVYRARGASDRAVRKYFRSLADVVILVVESRLAGLGQAAHYIHEIESDRRSRGDLDAPALVVFAHRADEGAALSSDMVAQELAVQPETKIIATANQGNAPAAKRAGVHRPPTHFGFALATSSAVQRVHVRDEAGLSRRVPTRFDQFLTTLRSTMPDSEMADVIDLHAPEPVEPAGQVAPSAQVPDRVAPSAPAVDRVALSPPPTPDPSPSARPVRDRSVAPPSPNRVTAPRVPEPAVSSSPPPMPSRAVGATRLAGPAVVSKEPEATGAHVIVPRSVTRSHAPSRRHALRRLISALRN
jgi:hypothetical protein